MINIDIYKCIKTRYLSFDLKVTTTFRSNAITRIAGPSGIGKTTLLKIIAGLIRPDQGSIAVNGDIWFNASTKTLKKVQDRNVGFVFQDYALFPNMTVEEHLLYGTKDETYIKRLLEIGELEKYRKSFPKQLSGGQQQRLAILRALSTQPGLLLMDEPFSALDHQTKMRLISKLQALFLEQKTTVLIVTHAENEMGDGVFEMG